MLELKDPRYNDIRLIFKEDGHSYTDTLGRSYTSATTLLHEYAPKFDKSYWLKKKARELKISTKELAKQWQTITDEACTRGTNTHNGLEDGIKGCSMFKKAINYLSLKTDIDDSMVTIADLPNIDFCVKPLDLYEFKEATKNKYPDIYNVFQFYIERDYKIYSEIGAFLIDYLLSGTIDVLCIREDQFVIGDWKTNRGGLKFEAGYYKKDKHQIPHQLTDEYIVKKENLLPPVSNMPNCNGSIYNLQTSLYAKFVELILGIPCAGTWLCHIDSDFELNEYGMPKRFPDGLYHIKDNPVETTTFFKLPYRKLEIERILADRLKVVKATQVQRTLFDL